MIQEEVFFENSEGQELRGILRVPIEDATDLPVIVICHGFMSHKDHRFLIMLGVSLSAAGYITLRFDFAHHGESEGEIEDMMFRQQVDDVRSAVKYVKGLEYVDPSKIILLGHSLGGSAAIVASVNNRDVRSLVTLNASAHLDRLIESYLNDYEVLQWQKQGVAMIMGNMIDKDFLKDVKKQDILDAVTRLECPVLFIYAQDDRRVNYANSRELFRDANQPKEVYFIEGADHDFLVDEHRVNVVELITDWLGRFVQ